MGLFSGKTTIFVASTLYNLAGPEEERTNYLKSTLFGAMISNAPSYGEAFQKSYLNGPGIRLRQFYNYADRNDIAGMPTATIKNTVATDAAVVKGEITVPSSPSGLEAVVTSAVITFGDPDPFLERWILTNHPTRINEIWVGDVVGQDFSVQFDNGDFYTFTDTEYDSEAMYVVAKYHLEYATYIGPFITGTLTPVTVLPDLTGFDPVSSTGTFTTVTLQRELVEKRTYSDGRPDEEDPPIDADVSANLNTSLDFYDRLEVVDTYGYVTELEYQRWRIKGTDSVTTGYFFEEVVAVEDIGGGVTRTTTHTTTGEQVAVSWTERYDTQERIKGEVYEVEKRFIYKEGTGNATLDALISDVDVSSFQEFFPFLPLRLDNVSILDDIYANVDDGINDPPFGNGLYTETKKAYRRMTGKSLNSIVGDIEDNPDIADIDYAYIMYGVSLNVEEHACRRYIYDFFKELIPYQNSTGTTMSEFQTQIAAYTTAITDLDNYFVTVAAAIGDPFATIPPRPEIPSLELPPISTLRLKTDSVLMPSYDIRLNWIHIGESLFSGKFTYTPDVGAPRDATINEIQMVKGTPITWTERINTVLNSLGSYDTIEHSIEVFEIYWQTDTNNYKVLTVYGMVHQNFVYGGKYVQISSDEALDDTDISGFIVPLHYPTFKEMSIIDYTQMSTANTHILFNSYLVTKQKWYETFLFKILLVVLIIVVSVVLNPAAFAAGSGLLGGNVAIGTALGLTGTAAIVAGVVANYLAAIVMSQVLSNVSTEIFGEKWGALFAALISVALSFAVSGTAIFSTEGILKLGNAIANGYQGFVRGEINELIEMSEQETKAYEEQMEHINDLLKGLSGNDLNFNPLSLTSTTYGNGRLGFSGYLPETADEFIRRTTMTGTDIIDITFSMIHDYVEVQQTLPRN